MSERTTFFINEPADIVDDMLAAYSDLHSAVITLDEGLIVRAEPKSANRVGLVIGNGSGHEPAMVGWVGPGLFDVNVPGMIFASPGNKAIAAGIARAAGDRGALLLVSSHAGDIMNARLAIDQATRSGIEAHMEIVYDDISSAPREFVEDRRGGPGLFFVWKIVGAAAERATTLSECAAIARRARDATRSLSAACGSFTNPVSGQRVGGTDGISIGLGVHGEAGDVVAPDSSAAEVVAVMIERLVDDGLNNGDRVGLLVNNAGSLTIMETSIIYGEAKRKLADHGVEVVRSWVGSYATTVDLAGFGLATCTFDDELLELYDAPAQGAAVSFTKGNR